MQLVCKKEQVTRVAASSMGKPLLKRRHASSACTVCRKYRCKCIGGRPCHECLKRQTDCISNKATDMRRKEALKNTLEVLNNRERCISWLGGLLEDQGITWARQAIDQVQKDIPYKSFKEHYTHDILQNNYSRAPQDFFEPQFDCSEHHISMMNDKNYQELRTKPLETPHTEGTHTYEGEMASGFMTGETLIGGIPSCFIMASTIYHISDTNFELVNPTEPWNMPAKDIAEKLIQLYFSASQACFPLVDEIEFRSTYHMGSNLSSCNFSDVETLVEVDLILAISAKYAYITDLGLGLSDDTHMHYFAYANKLCSHKGWNVEYSAIKQIEIQALTALYMLVTGRPYRAWKLISSAADSATTLGLCSDKSTVSTSDIQRFRYDRKWWSLWSLQLNISLIVGLSNNRNALARLPMPFEFDLRYQDAYTDMASSTCFLRLDKRFPNSSHLFFHYLQILTILDESLSDINTLHYTQSPTGQAQARIFYLLKKCEQWIDQLPPELDFRSVSSSESISLQLLFLRTKIMITRPFPYWGWFDEGKRSEMNVFDQQITGICVNAAMELIAIFLASPVFPTAFELPVWISTLDSIIRSFLVLMWRISIPDKLMGPPADEVFTCANKAIGYINKCSTRDDSWHQAWLLCRHICYKAGPKKY